MLHFAQIWYFESVDSKSSQLPLSKVDILLLTLLVLVQHLGAEWREARRLKTSPVSILQHRGWTREIV